MIQKGIVTLTAVVGIGVSIAAVSSPSGHEHSQHGVELVVRPAETEKGADLYRENCSSCHGATAMGTDRGPPFIHKIYEPSHHGDASFQTAAKNGVRAHHWPFGNMPPVPNVTDADAALIVRYIRELQRANGIR